MGRHLQQILFRFAAASYFLGQVLDSGLNFGLQSLIQAMQGGNGANMFRYIMDLQDQAFPMRFPRQIDMNVDSGTLERRQLGGKVDDRFPGTIPRVFRGREQVAVILMKKRQAGRQYRRRCGFASISNRFD